MDTRGKKIMAGLAKLEQIVTELYDKNEALEKENQRLKEEIKVLKQRPK